MLADDKINTRLVDLASRGDAILDAREGTPFQGRTIWRVSAHESVAWSTSVASLLQQVFGRESVHYVAFKEHLSNFHQSYEAGFRNLQAVLLAAKDDYQGGYIFSIRGLVKAEVLVHAMTQALELLDAGYKDPACVLVGVSLEVTIKELAERQALSPAKLEVLNAGLCKAGTYNLAKQKQVTAWADLRNKAAHGTWGAYSSEDVRDMHRGVERFIADLL